MVNEDRAVHQAHSIWCLKNADRNAARSGAGGGFPFFGAEGKRNDILQAWVFAKAACPCCCLCVPGMAEWVPYYRCFGLGPPQVSTQTWEQEFLDTHDGEETWHWTLVGEHTGILAGFWCSELELDATYEVAFWYKGAVEPEQEVIGSPGEVTTALHFYGQGDVSAPLGTSVNLLTAAAWTQITVQFTADNPDRIFVQDLDALGCDGSDAYHFAFGVIPNLAGEVDIDILISGMIITKIG